MASVIEVTGMRYNSMLRFCMHEVVKAAPENEQRAIGKLGYRT